MSKKVKVAFMIPMMGKYKRGAETFPSLIAENLSKDFDVTIYTAPGTISLHPLAQTSWSVSFDNIVLRTLYKLFKPVNGFLGEYFSYWPVEVECLTFSLGLIPKLLRENYDVIFPVSIWGVMIASLVRRLKGTKYIYINHGGAEKFILKRKPDVFVAPTEDVVAWVKKNFPEVRSVCILNGINLEQFSPRILPVDLKLERPIFLCVGAFTAYKRIDLTIKAVAKLKKGSLVVLGQGELKEKLEKMGGHLLGQKRFLLKRVDHKEISSYYSACDVFTLASTKEEVLGAVYLEALASNKPVVAGDDERRRFIIGSAGLLCDVSDVNEYAKVLEKVAKINYGQKPRQRARKMFDIKNSVRKYKEVIDSLIEQK